MPCSCCCPRRTSSRRRAGELPRPSAACSTPAATRRARTAYRARHRRSRRLRLQRASHAGIMRWKYAKLLIEPRQRVPGRLRPRRRRARISQGRVRDEALACYRAAGIDCASEERWPSAAGDVPHARDRRPTPRWRLVLAEPRPQHRLARDRLPQRRDRPARPLHGVPTPLNPALQRIAIRMPRDSLPVGSVPVAEVEAIT